MNLGILQVVFTSQTGGLCVLAVGIHQTPSDCSPAYLHLREFHSSSFNRHIFVLNLPYVSHYCGEWGRRELADPGK